MALKVFDDIYISNIADELRNALNEQGATFAIDQFTIDQMAGVVAYIASLIDGSGSEGKTISNVTITTKSGAGQNAKEYGDANGDGVIDSNDLDMVAKYNAQMGTITYPEAVDFFGNGVISLSTVIQLQRLIDRQLIYVRVVVTFTDTTTSEYVFPLSLPTIYPKMVTGTYEPSENIAGEISIEHDLGAVPDIALFWTESEDSSGVAWGGGVAALLACGYFVKPYGTGTKNFYVRQTSSGTVSAGLGTTSTCGMITPPTDTYIYPKGVSSYPINARGIYKWAVIKF